MKDASQLQHQEARVVKEFSILGDMQRPDVDERTSLQHGLVKCLKAEGWHLIELTLPTLKGVSNSLPHDANVLSHRDAILTGS